MNVHPWLDWFNSQTAALLSLLAAAVVVATATVAIILWTQQQNATRTPNAESIAFDMKHALRSMAERSRPLYWTKLAQPTPFLDPDSLYLTLSSQGQWTIYITNAYRTYRFHSIWRGRSRVGALLNVPDLDVRETCPDVKLIARIARIRGWEDDDGAEELIVRGFTRGFLRIPRERERKREGKGKGGDELGKQDRWARCFLRWVLERYVFETEEEVR